ncbi:hypothetical protein RN001_013779 [Aquatica leii]|uniref:F-box domain-containing protein n=1 Tax=Aquatica leii TaxID=1421715 RepID=A0AAN7P0J6_9COLE|nr:hypothetical protein RN001_013779 [Aquatica leii]
MDLVASLTNSNHNDEYKQLIAEKQNVFEGISEIDNTEYEIKLRPGAIEQFVQSVLSYSSKYNSISSILYAPENLIGKPSKYPMYGDFPDTYLLRSYGKWWKESEAAQPEYMPHDVDPIPSEDFVTVRFEYAVFPKDVFIYETYHPGAVVRIWGRKYGNPWNLLWKGPPQTCPVASRKYSPPIRQIKELINELRIEFNQSHLRYHTSLDAILLTGFRPKSLLQMTILQKGLLDTFVKESCERREQLQCFNDDGVDLFCNLPFEVMVHIFQYLDLKSLCRCAQVNKKWYFVSLDPALYRAISLKKYWHKVDNKIIQDFMNKCKNVKKLDLSWCSNEKQIKEVVFVQFLEQCCKNITHLSLDCCSFINTIVLGEIGKCNDLTDLRLRNCKRSVKDFGPLAQLHKLTALDLCSSCITDEQLINILKANTNLKHLIIDFCDYLETLDQVAETVSMFNPYLVTWSSWKTLSFTSEGIGHLARCSYLRELDLGWCLILNEPANCIEKISLGCKDLRRLIISGWRGVNDHLLLPLIRSCKQLTQLDLLGIKNISSDICERILASLPKLTLLDISFCDLIKTEQVLIWREQYPNVVIQH